MTDIRTCRHCGASTEFDSGVSGYCPACLLRGMISQPTLNLGGYRPRSHPEGESLEELAYLGHRLEILSRIGEGGMGVVYEADQPDFGRRVAVKVLREEHEDDQGLRRRFYDEAQVGGRLQHPGVLPIYSLGAFGERPFFTMRLIQGRTFAQALESGPDLSWSLGVFLQVCQTVAYAHSRGVLHRDLKPSNVMVGDFGEVLVVDWGVARRLRGGPQPSPSEPGVDLPGTNPGGVVGTPAYMSPEQARGDGPRQDERSDVFGLGAILCQVLTGQPPYVHPNRTALVTMAREGDLSAAFERIDRAAADDELKRLARACLDPDPANRPGDAGEVAARVQDYQTQVRRRLDEAQNARVRAEVKAVEERRRWALTFALVGVCTLAGVVWYADRVRAAQRRNETVAAVTASVAEARSLREQGRSLDARAAFRKAEGLLAASGDAAVRRQFERPLDDLAMLTRLDDARYVPSQLGSSRVLPAQTATAYAEAFRAYGLDLPKVEPARAAEVIRGSAIRAELVSALDDWCRAESKKATRDALRAVSDAADTDPDGPAGRLRRALARADRAALGALAREVNTTTLPASLLASLGAGLRDQKAFDESAEVLRSARATYPGDFWINLELAATLMARSPDRPESASVPLGAALALSRNNPGVYFYLASSLQNLGLLDAAVAQYEEAIALRPDYPEAYCNLGNTLTRQKKYSQAEVAFREAIRLRPDYALAHYNLGCAFDEQGKLDLAIAAYRESERIKKDYAEAYSNEGFDEYRLGRFGEAAASLARALDLMETSEPRRTSFKGILEMARSLAPLEPRLASVLDGPIAAELPVDDLVGFARLCSWQNRSLHAHAVRFYREAFRRKPALADDLAVGDRYAAAGSAALAGTGGGADASSLAMAERADLRRQALAWLQADLDRRRAQLEKAGASLRREIESRLRYWLVEPNFRGVRGPALEALPEPERREWLALWAAHAQLVAQTSTPPH